MAASAWCWEWTPKRWKKSEKIPCGYEIVINGGRTYMGMDALEWALKAQDLGAGEICLNSIDADGTKDGYELDLTAMISQSVDIPVIASGGAGIPDHLARVLTKGKADAALIASMVHYGHLHHCPDQGGAFRPGHQGAAGVRAAALSRLFQLNAIFGHPGSHGIWVHPVNRSAANRLMGNMKMTSLAKPQFTHGVKKIGQINQRFNAWRASAKYLVFLLSLETLTWTSAFYGDHITPRGQIDWSDLVVVITLFSGITAANPHKRMKVFAICLAVLTLVVAWATELMGGLWLNILCDGCLSAFFGLVAVMILYDIWTSHTNRRRHGRHHYRVCLRLCAHRRYLGLFLLPHGAHYSQFLSFCQR